MVSWKALTIFPIWSCLLFLCVSYAKKRVVYTGYEAHRFTPATHEDLKILKNLETNHGLIFWRQVGAIGQPVDIMFAPHQQTDLLQSLKQQMTSKILSHDVEKTLDHDNNIRTLETLEDNIFPFTTYWDLAVWRSFLLNLQNTHPEICKIEQYGTSSGPAELPLEAMVVSTTLNQPTLKKPALFIDGGTHSREVKTYNIWITVMGCSHFLKEVLTNFAAFVLLFENFDMVFACCANPEGFQYSWDVNRFWRKTRTPTSMSPACDGVDPNRNYDFGFGGGGTSTDPCSDIYHGERAFSISETKNLSDYAKSKNSRSYTSLHSYSQLVLLGYGCKTGNIKQKYPTFDKDQKMATAATDALTKVHGTPYSSGNSDAILYEACGTSQDWFLANVCDYAWTYELRDTGTWGFALPADQVEPTCQETTASLALLHQMMAKDLVDRKMARKDNGHIIETN